MEVDLQKQKLVGIEGWDRVLTQVANLWAEQVSREQAHRYLAGVQPIRSLVNVGKAFCGFVFAGCVLLRLAPVIFIFLFLLSFIGAGVADLLLMPLETYRRNGRLVTGLRKGASSFARSVSLETMSVGTTLAQGIKH